MEGRRTTVGIVEWARRAHGARAVELHVADRLGSWVVVAPDAATKVAIVRCARRHAWRAEQWDAVVPVLHDVDVAEDLADPAAPLGDPGLAVALEGLASSTAPEDALAAAEVVCERLVSLWRAWEGDAAPVADAPFAGVLEIVIRDALGDQAP